MAKSSGMTIPELRREVASGTLRPLYLLLGAETALRRRAAEAIAAAFGAGGEVASGGVVRMDGASTPVAEILDEARSLPLFATMSDAPSKMVWVSRFDKREDDGTDILTEYLEDPVDATCLVLEAEALDKRRALTKVLTRAAGVVDCEPPRREGDVALWIRATLSERGFEIEPEATAYLLEMTGGSITALEQELEKVMLRAAGASVVRTRDLEGLLGRSREHSVFELTDALVRGDAGDALRMLNLLLDDGEEPIRLLAMIAWITRQLVIAHDVGRSGRSRKEAMEALGGRWQQRGLILDRARRARRGALRAALAGCADADLFVKRMRDARAGADRHRPARGRLEALCRQICAA